MAGGTPAAPEGGLHRATGAVAARAEAKAPFLNAVGRKAPLNAKRGGSPAPLIENDLSPTDVKERPGALAAASTTEAAVRLARCQPPPRL